MEEINYMRLMIGALICLWFLYPAIIVQLRPKAFKDAIKVSKETSNGNSPLNNIIFMYSFIIGLSTSIGTMITLSFFSGNTLTADIYNKGFLVGFIFETIILFSDKLEKIFNIDLRTNENIKKSFFIYLISFIVIMKLLSCLL